ncbi:hypothetical protein C2I18_24550 [Paenibacillus sp. PK3_47]|uniref:hypothetical protein n=1 Tax=Paenibacillus sp. PK3_47 TaxID=2072642 RepID=UPI00201DECBA|nr:hypothetical protein [Paenibacillus sp. PK3_47]UQZ36422.1 hypothetical protein C2I18_24550 [Paenibacillus sp. PK3_47]
MENVSNEVKQESVKALQSTLRKLENALSQMTRNGANTTLVNKRLQAVQVSLAVLQKVWEQVQHSYTPSDLAKARKVITDLLPSVESSYAKSKAGSPQKTLLERRIKALELAVQAMGEQE